MIYVGYVRLHRRVRKNPVWTQLSPAVYKFLSYCVMEANWEPQGWYDGVRENVVPAGSFVSSLRQMAADCHLGLQQVRDAIRHLDALGITRTQVMRAPGKTHEITAVTLLNYGSYQAAAEGKEHTKEHAKEHASNTRGTREQHAKNSETVEDADNCRVFNGAVNLDRAALKEEECKKGRREEDPLPLHSGNNGFRALVEWQMDETYAPFVEAYRGTGKPLIDEDFADAHFSWKRLDFDQKQQATRGVRERVEAGVWNDPTFVPVPKRYLASEWKRPVVAPRKSGARRSALAEMIEG